MSGMMRRRVATNAEIDELVRSAPNTNDKAMLNLAAAKSLPNRIADSIVDGIAAGALQPGQRLTEEWLAKSLNVSRIPLREALKTLEAQGVIERSYGVRVPEYDDARIDRVCHARVALESLAAVEAQTVLRRDKTGLQTLDQALQRMDDALHLGNASAFMRADIAFHREIVVLSGNDIVLTLWDSLARHVWIVFGSEVRAGHMGRSTLDQHCEIRNVLVESNIDVVRRLLRNHILQFRRHKAG